jgi:hypothetical protein
MSLVSKDYFEKFLAVCILATVAVAWWQYDTYRDEKQAARRKDHGAAQQSAGLAKTIDLPNGDGRLYVIHSPADRFGFEVHVCMVHVRSGSNSAMACSHTAPATPLPSD